MMQEFSMHILDIAQNSIAAEAKKVIIEICEDANKNCLTFSITDNGRGMTQDMIQKIRDPFTTSRVTRKVGLGIPFLEQTCEQCGGSLHIESTLGVGTTLTATLALDSIDRPPMGDIGGAIYLTIVTNPQVDFQYIHRVGERHFELDTEEIKTELEGIPINHPDVMTWLKESIEEGLSELFVV